MGARTYIEAVAKHGSKKHKRRRRSLVTFRRRQAPGTTPGTLTIAPEMARPALRAISYDAQAVEETELTDLGAIDKLRQPGRTLWLDVVGLGDAELIGRLGGLFGLHPLALEDVLNLHQRPKVEAYGETLFVVLRMPSYAGELGLEQVSLFLGEGFVVTLQERSGDCFEPVRQRLRLAQGRVRREGADYLAYALIDAIVDHYFPILETYGDRLESLEDRVIAAPETAALAEVHTIRHELYALRRALWPTRDALAELGRMGAGLVRPETQIFLRDCHDHAVQLIDVVEACRELGSSLMDLYLSGLSQRMNEVMKVLTLIATIFIPLSFVAGLYGMNFDAAASPWNMPELRWRFGYPFALGLMALIAAGMLGYFRKKGWLGASPPTRNETEPVTKDTRHD